MINELRKAIDDYWASKRKTYAKGRIKNIRGIYRRRGYSYCWDWYLSRGNIDYKWNKPIRKYYRQH